MTVLIALVLGARLAARAPAAVAIPGQPLAAFEKQRRGLMRSGGMFDPELPPGESFLIYENHIGKEYRIGKTVLPCDPTDSSGYTYVPKTLLTVLKSRSGQQTVICDRRISLIRSLADIPRKIAAENAFLAAHQDPPSSLAVRLGRWWHRNVLQKPYLKMLQDDGHEVIYGGSAEGGRLGEIVLVTEFPDSADDGVVTTTPERIPGTMKVIRYLTRFKRPALQDLAHIGASKPH